MQVFERKPRRAKKELKQTIVPKSKSNDNVYYNFQEFTENVGIAGLKHLGEEGRSYVQRIIWLIILIIAATLSIMLVYKTFVKWHNSPVIVTFATEQESIYKIPFPAVTICPETKTLKSVLNFGDLWLKKFKNMKLTPKETFDFNTISLICNPHTQFANEDDLFTDDQAIILMNEVKESFYRSLVQWKWKGNREKHCTPEDFTQIVTSEGICYTFNGNKHTEIFTDQVQFPDDVFWNHQHDSEWTIESGYSENSGIDAYPRRTPVAGVQGGFKIILNGTPSDIDFACKEVVSGFKISIHDPAEFPRLEESYFQLPINQALSIVIKPNLMTTSDDLRGYNPQDRKCYYSHEKKLDYFKTYNQNNCLLECLTKFTLQNCNCVRFYMPRNRSIPICGTALKICANKAKDDFLISEANKGQALKNTSISSNNSCDCLPSCHSLDFDVEISQADWNVKELYQAIYKFTNLTHDENPSATFEELDTFGSHLTIYYKNIQFSPSERNELYSYIDFWANVGGVLGLFTGFSFITIFEILYYLSLRLTTCNVKMFGRRVWSGSPKIRDEFSSNVKGEKDNLDTPL